MLQCRLGPSRSRWAFESAFLTGSQAILTLSIQDYNGGVRGVGDRDDNFPESLPHYTPSIEVNEEIKVKLGKDRSRAVLQRQSNIGHQ